MLVRVIGNGGMGTVYEAVHLDLGRKVAIKLLDAAADERALQRFRREALAAAAIHHPNVVGVTDFDPGSTNNKDGEDDHHPAFIAMELLPGRSLAEHLEQVERRLSISRAVSITVQMLEGLEAAHEHGIVHRDIKPSNVFLIELPGNRHLVKLLDFGIAKLLEDEHSIRTTTGSFVGTPRYVSPEQVRSGVVVDARSDVHAVSACLYEMLTGERAFRGTNAADVIAAILRPERPHIANEDIPRALANVVERGLSHDRETRWPTARAMRDALTPWLEGGVGGGDVPRGPSPQAAHQAPPPAHHVIVVGKPRRRSRIAIIFAAALVVTILIGIAIASIVVMSRPTVLKEESPYAPAPSASASTTADAMTSSSAEAPEVPISPSDSASVSASASAAATPTAPPKLYSTRIVEVVVIDQASADEWIKKHGGELRRKCGQRRSCHQTLRITATGKSRAPFTLRKAVQPPGCDPNAWICVADYLEAHPIDPKMECPPEGRASCEHQVVFGFE
jgi:serine/threonine protein kinase